MLQMRIELSSDSHMEAEFHCDVTGETFLLWRPVEGYSLMVLQDPQGEHVLNFSTTHKTKRSTLIAKCLDYFEKQPRHQTGLVIMGKIAD